MLVNQSVTYVGEPDQKQEVSGWGTKVIEKLAKDLQNEFPGMKGFSRANAFYMRSFYVETQKVQQLVGQISDLPFFSIPWGHNIVLLHKINNEKERLWYAQKTIEYGWSRSALSDWIKSDIYSREGKAITNFAARLPNPQSQLAQETLKDPYCFDFLTLSEGHQEKELEQGLVELGHEFA